MPSGSTSRRKASDKPSTANLVALYWPSAGMPRTPASDDRLTMQPRRRLRMPGSTACTMLVRPNTLTSNILRTSAAFTAAATRSGCVTSSFSTRTWSLATSPGRTLGVALVLPGLEAAFGRRQRAVELGTAEVLEASLQLAVVGIDALVRHEEASSGGCALQAARAG
jgi:hypothetical protein